MTFFHIDRLALYHYYTVMKRPSRLGSIIKTHRKNLGLTSDALAKKVGIDRTYISKIENYNLIPSWEILSAIGRELKIDGLQTLYLEQKHPEIIYDKGDEKYAADAQSNDKTTALRNEIFDFISQTTPKHRSTIRAFAANILNRYKPSETANDKLIGELSRLIEKTTRDYRSYQKLYNETENEIIRLIAP